MSTGHGGDYGNTIMQKRVFVAGQMTEFQYKSSSGSKWHLKAGTIAVVAENGTVDQAGTARAKAFASSSKALLISRMLMTPIRV